MNRRNTYAHMKNTNDLKHFDYHYLNTNVATKGYQKVYVPYSKNEVVKR